MEDTVILPIKKRYFMEILNKNKRYEYREVKPFYENKFNNKKYKYVTFYYYTEARLTVELLSVKKEKNNLDSEIINTPYMYVLSLGKVIAYTPPL